MGNNAVDVNDFTNNSGAVNNHITAHGSNWYFAVCAVMGSSQIRLTLTLAS
jgi:bacteriorhodopsin